MDASVYLDSHWNKNKIWNNLKRPKHQERFRLIVNQLVGETFIDVGCGVGHSTAIMRKMKGADVGSWTAVEFYDKNVKAGNRIFKKFFPIVYCPEDTLDLHGSLKKKFDTVVCSEVMEHVENDVLLIRNLIKITKKRLVLTTPCVYVNDPGHLRIYTEQMIHALMEKCGISKFALSKEIEAKGRKVFWYVVINV